MEVAAIHPTAHMGARAAPLLRGKPNRTRGPGSCPRPQGCRPAAAWAVTYWFSSLRAAWGTETGASAGLSDTGPRPIPRGPTPSQENRTTAGGETRCGLHGGGWEGLRAPEAAPWKSGQTGTEGHQGGRGEVGAGAQRARYSQRLVGTLLGFEEAQDKEGHCLQTQHHHHATDEAGPVKAGAVGLRDRGALCRVEATAGHCRPGAWPHPKTPHRSSGGPQSSLGEPWAAGSDIPPRFYRWLQSAWKHLALAPLQSCAVA